MLRCVNWDWNFIIVSQCYWNDFRLHWVRAHFRILDKSMFILLLEMMMLERIATLAKLWKPIFIK